MSTVTEKSLAIENEALRLGFSACGFSKAEPLAEDAERLKKWLEDNHHGSMHYMENHFEKRTDPTQLVEGARTVVSLLLNYYTDERQHDPEAPVISKYAYGTDYHFVMKDKMKSLLIFMDAIFGPVTGRVFVDSAPVLDRAWARKAGLGWIGKHSNLINRDLGSFVFIGEIICDLELEYNTVPEGDFCGACSICIDACPTDAILDNRTIDSNKCISYLTIENRDEIPEQFKGQLANRAVGCDICQDVCPWNSKAEQHHVREFEPAQRLLEMKKTDWETLDKAGFNALFRHSAVKRTGYKGLMRNITFLKKT
ncbi:MAG: tRNA epoxyqueuosine(34) reductase QueG [Bacteroidales bacterium]|nr:tRNA epoxyqueuosine(34) reductase QueG [Bacteroidales bacterium]MDT8431763.1 tRNA epoxyqueuosine(34) reductase QueG [Bacteroidales bacterium]